MTRVARSWVIVLAGAVALTIALVIGISGAPARAASPHTTATVTVTPNTGLTSGQSVTVAISGYPANATAYGVECDEHVATASSNPDGYCNTSNYVAITTDGTGSGSGTFTVYSGSAFTSANGQGVCDSSDPCYMAVSSGSTDGIAVMQFAPATTTTTSTTTTPTGTTTTGTTTTGTTTTPSTTTTSATATTATTTTTTSTTPSLGIATAKPSAHLRNGQKVTVAISKFPANAAVFGVECDARILTTGNDAWCNKAHYVAINTDASGEGTASFVLSAGSSFVSGNKKGVCDALHPCYVALTTQGAAQVTDALAEVYFGQASKTTILAAHREVPVGASVKLTVTVTRSAVDGALGGSVTLKNGSKTVGTKKLSPSGRVTFNEKLTAGTHKLTASYSGSTTYLPSASAVTITAKRQS